MSDCDYCHAKMIKPRKGQRFCTTPGKHCRQEWHREHSSPGIVGGLRQLKSGTWQFTVRYPSQPEVLNGDRVLVIKGD